MAIYDVIVVGAGVNGSSTAFALSEKKKSVLLLEQVFRESTGKGIVRIPYKFPLPHVRGSSHGQTRVFRCVYRQSIYAKMSLDSIAMWREMEKRLNETLLIQNGVIELIDKQDHDTLKTMKEILTGIKVPYEIMSSSEINRRFPPFNLPSNYCGIYERQGGAVMADKCVAAFQTLFKRNGGVLQDNEQVVKVIPGDICTVVTNKGSYSTKSVVITAGPFSKNLLQNLGLNVPLEVVRTHICYWKLPSHTVGTIEAGFPSFNFQYKVYGMASMEYPGLMKICLHGGTKVENIDFPDRPPVLEPIQRMIRTCMKGVLDEPSVVEGCIYTNTPDKNFILDTHPKHKNIVIGCGFSGTSFKMSPVTGKVLADMALGEKPSYDLSELRIGRFKNIISTKSVL